MGRAGLGSRDGSGRAGCVWLGTRAFADRAIEVRSARPPARPLARPPARTPTNGAALGRRPVRLAARPAERARTRPRVGVYPPTGRARTRHLTAHCGMRLAKSRN